MKKYFLFFKRYILPTIEFCLKMIADLFLFLIVHIVKSKLRKRNRTIDSMEEINTHEAMGGGYTFSNPPQQGFTRASRCQQSDPFSLWSEDNLK